MSICVREVHSYELQITEVYSARNFLKTLHGM